LPLLRLILSFQLRYTKPGITGQTYPVMTVAEKQQNENTDYQEIIFGHKSAAMQKITPQQNHQLQLVYQQELQKKMEQNKIPMDEIDDLVASLLGVTDDLETLLAEGDFYTDQTAENENNYSSNRRSWKRGKFTKSCLVHYLRSSCFMFR
jgi:hypothetical protein